MIKLNKVLVGLISIMLLVFGYCFWVAAQKAPRQGGPDKPLVN